MSAGLRKIGRALGIGLALLAVLALALLLGDRLAPTARTVYLGGPILTMDGESRVVEAIAVEGDRIAAVGEEAALRAFARERGAEIFDLEGRALLPGFIDAHGHFPGEGLREIH